MSKYACRLHRAANPSGFRSGVLSTALIALTLALAAAGAAQPEACRVGEDAPSVALSVVTAAGLEQASALVALLRAALEQRGVRAHEVPPPAACSTNGATDPACATAVLRALAAGTTHAAVLPLPAARPPHVLLLRDSGLEELGDATPPVRITCAASPPARSLLEFHNETLAERYHLAPHQRCSSSNESEYEYSPEWCTARGCGTLLTGSRAEAREMSRVVRRHELRLRVFSVAPACLTLAPLICSFAPELLSGPLRPLGVPPCLPDACPFDPYRLVKIVNAQKLVHSPTATRILARMALSEKELREMSAEVGAAARLAARHEEWVGGAEVRVAVMIPARSPHDAFDGNALRAAATLAELDAPADGRTEFKVELLDDECSATRAFKYLTDAPGGEWGALSAVAGPACGAAFADVARQSPALRLPSIAYTPQAPAGALTLLAAGDARQHTRAHAALLARLGWRRFSVLSELATRAALDASELGPDMLLHVELGAERADPDLAHIEQWAVRTAAAHGRVLYVCAEDARVVRAALCAGRAAGLTPRRGAVWLLPAALPTHWMRRAPGDEHPCTTEQLREVAEGHLSIAPAWMTRWDPGATAERRAWTARWATQCGKCSEPPAHAAVLYDALRLWHDALRRLLRRHPAALDDLHCNTTVRSLVEDATTSNYSGLTGTFEWVAAGEGFARTDLLVLQQWLDGTQHHVADWLPGVGLTTLHLRWLTADGTVPDDGTEHCPLQPLADLLRAECATAVVALGATVLVALAGLLGAAAYRCKQRAESDYRRRLAALGLREPLPKPGELDRWEIPREHVVINRKLGTGAFGTVYGGHALLSEERGWSAVAVKTLKAGASTEQKLDFLSEAEAMKRFEHKNVVRLLGVVTKTEPVCTVMEFMLYGDLKSYLLSRRQLAGGAGGESGEVSAPRLTRLARDAARGLSYLAQLRYVHRDVAARNCLVGANRVLKLADFGMTRPVCDSDYYRFSRKGMLPVRWMAPEALALGIFSPASDVWAFGVLLYEIVTFGALPFQGLSNAEVLARVKAGHTLDLPPEIKPQLAGLMKLCWARERAARPAAAELAAYLAEWPRLLEPCLGVPLDPLPLDAPWPMPSATPSASPSAATDSTEVSAEAPPRDTDAFLP